MHRLIPLAAALLLSTAASADALCDTDSHCAALEIVWEHIAAGDSVDYAVAAALDAFVFLSPEQIAELRRNAYKGAAR